MSIRSMTRDIEQVDGKQYCNVAAQAVGLDPVGNAGSFDDAVIIEAPLPWHRDLYQTAGTLPQEMIDLMRIWREQYEQTGSYRHRPLLIAPDPDYSAQGLSTVIFYSRPQRPFAHFAKIEYQVATEDLGALIWAWFMQPDRLPAFDCYRRSQADSIRDILVCTHGTIDVACAKFGYPLYRDLRDNCANGALRVWRVSHFGGHLFAPTLIDMPTGHYWAFVGQEQAAQIIHRDGDVAQLRGHYRGWAGVERGFAQAAECEMWQRTGWRWFNADKAGAVVAQDPHPEKPAWANVQITERLSDRIEKTYCAQVEVKEWVTTQPASGRSDSHDYPKYCITEWRKEATNIMLAGTMQG